MVNNILFTYHYDGSWMNLSRVKVERIIIYGIFTQYLVLLKNNNNQNKREKQKMRIIFFKFHYIHKFHYIYLCIYIILKF
jgi:hypothetical protein